MSKFVNRARHSVLRGGVAIFVLGAVLLAFPFTAVAQYLDYEGPEYCKLCHEQKYNDWKASGHPYILMESENAMNRPIPLPKGVDWDDLSYTVGGYKWKSRYLDSDGYVIDDIPGQNQYNLLTGDFVEGDSGGSTECFSCHSTGWVANEDPTDLSGNQDGLPGIPGTFVAPGVQCEQCHGPGFDSMTIDRDAAACGECHSRGDVNTIPASNGFIMHQETYNEFLAGPHARFDCVTCHDPHLKAEFSIVRQCEDCHRSTAASYAMNPMADYGVECKDCHMPFATLSAQQLAPHTGDFQTHIFYINTDPAANMFTADGQFVKLDDDGKAAVTMDFACQRCHLTASLDELALYAEGFHDNDNGLENIGLDPGLTGTWWKESRAGEGILLEVGYDEQGQLFMFASFYTYGPDGDQVWLTAQLTSADGTTANVDVFVPQGGEWGDAFVSADVTATPWGSGTFTFPTCEGGSFNIMPNASMQAMGFTNLAYSLTRTLDSGVACPTFVNNEMAAAMGQ